MFGLESKLTQLGERWGLHTEPSTASMVNTNVTSSFSPVDRGKKFQLQKSERQEVLE